MLFIVNGRGTSAGWPLTFYLTWPAILTSMVVVRNRFGIKGLRAAGERTNSAAIISAVTFLLSHQNGNGGWGESHISGYNKSYGNGTASLNEG